MYNIGIFAHVDAGKTTLSEQLLLKTEAIRTAGSVDKGTAHTDTLPVERRRGISVRSACVRLRWKGRDINLIDTPGHTDFSAEIERSLWALDAAVLVVSAVEGVQPQTSILFEALKNGKLPVILFVNKCDRDIADLQRTVIQIQKKLTGKAVLIDNKDALAEAVAADNDVLLEKYLSGENISEAELNKCALRMVTEAQLYPVLSGSALRGTGISELLDCVVDLLPPSEATQCDQLCGVAFAAVRDKALGKGLYIRMFSGTLRSRDSLQAKGRLDPYTGEHAAVSDKITQIRDVTGTDKGILASGEIGIVYGLSDFRVGDVIGNEKLLPHKCAVGELRTPVMTMKAYPDDPDNMEKLAAACMELSDEDPLLHARYSRVNNELQLDVMGSIQTEILGEILENRYSLKASFVQPSVIYKETIARAARGFCAYTMPKPCWAILEFIIKPLPRGSGVRFHSEVDGRDILPRYQHQVEQAIPLALSQGRLGWQVIDVDIALVGGSHHQFHTHPLDFIVATPWGVQDGLQHGGSVLLEPVLRLNMRIPYECVGRIITDVNNMRGEISEIKDDEDCTLVTALVPAVECMDYSITLARVTSGRGSMSSSLHSYGNCPAGFIRTAPRRSVDPLDTAKYILAARSALESGIFDME